MASTPDPALHYAGPLAVLADARTMSCGDFSTAFLHLTGRAKTFGHPSGGGFGNGTFKQLDAGWSVGVNDILCSDTAGSYLEGKPPPVDFPVEYLPADILAGKDTVIEAARAWVAKQASP